MKRITAKIQAEVRAMEAKEMAKIKSRTRSGKEPFAPRIAAMEDRLVKRAELPKAKTVIKKPEASQRPTIAKKKKPIVVRKKKPTLASKEKAVVIRKKKPTLAPKETAVVISRSRSELVTPIKEPVNVTRKSTVASKSNKFEYGNASPVARANEVALGHVEQAM